MFEGELADPVFEHGIDVAPYVVVGLDVAAGHHAGRPHREIADPFEELDSTWCRLSHEQCVFLVAKMVSRPTYVAQTGEL